jgi:hypothetical protein
VPSAGLRTGFGPYDRSRRAIRGPRGTGGSGDGTTTCGAGASALAPVSYMEAVLRNPG